MDDAAISYAYARSLATGHGLVAQPGAPLVEGFSNPLWVFLLALLHGLGLFHPAGTARALGALGFGAATSLVVRERPELPAAMARTLPLALAAPVVIWTASGLENAMTLALVAGLWVLVVHGDEARDLRAGLVAGCLALTHPENALYLLLPLGAAALWPRRAARVLAGFLASFGPYLVFRLATFGLPFPHTYYAKRMHPDLASQLLHVFGDPGRLGAKLHDVALGLGGPGGPVVYAAATAFLVACVATGRADRAARTSLALLALALLAYLWIDVDWMGEYRFATALALAFTLVTAHAFERAWDAGRGRALLGAAALAWLASLGADSYGRLVYFAAEPTTPMADVLALRADRFGAYAEQLSLARPSLFLPDVGGALWRDRLRVVDAAGLVTPEVVHLIRGTGVVWLYDHPAFYDWFFERARPTFVNTYGFFHQISGLGRDPRFTRYYVAVDGYPDDLVEAATGWRLTSGDFVRRDALGADPVAALAALRALPFPPHLERWVVRAGLAGPPPGTPAAALLAQAGHELDGPREDRRLPFGPYGNPARPHRAAALAARARGAAPDDLAAWHLEARALDRAGRHPEARQAWRRVRDLAAAGGAHALAARADRRLGTDLMARGLALRYQEGRPEAAAAYFHELLWDQPEHYGGTYQLAAALQAAGRPAEARPVWEAMGRLATRHGDQAVLRDVAAALAGP